MSGPTNMATRQHRFKALVEALLPDLYRYAVWLSRDTMLADDLVQETLLRAWRSLGSLRDERAARRWLITILRREFFREYGRRRPEPMDLTEMDIRDTVASVGGDDTDLQDMREAMMKLQEEYREPLVLQVLMGCTVKEIAEMMKLTEGAVLTRLHRARKMLSEMLQASVALPQGRRA